MTLFSTVFIAVLVLSTGLQWWLAARHARHVATHRNSVPEWFRQHISLDLHRKAADYTIAKTRLSIYELVTGAILLLVWTLGGGLSLLAHTWASVGLSELSTGIALMVSTGLLLGLLELPFSAYRTFAIEQRFGFNRTTPRIFLTDIIKATGLLLVLGTPLCAVVLWLMDYAGTLWWIYVWLAWVTFSMALVWLYPVLIAPIFNTFVPLDDDSLRVRIEDLLRRHGFSLRGVFVMDGSRRSGHGNAYFTGLGANKRIVFFDTLLEKLNAAETESVLAHEVGHFKRRHVAKQMFLSAGLSFTGLALLGWLIDKSWFYTGLGIQQPSTALALIVFLMIMPTVLFFLQPLGAWLSRRHEFEADDFATRETDPAVLIGALAKLYRENASTLTPDPLYSAFHDSHPPAPVRIAHLCALEEAHAS